MIRLMLSAACVAIMTAGCADSNNDNEKTKAQPESVVKEAPIEGVRDMNVKAPVTVQADVLLNTGINFGPWEPMGSNVHTVTHHGRTTEVTDNYFVRQLWHAVYDRSVTPPKGERQTICMQVMVKREAGSSSLTGTIGKYNMECTESAEQFSNHPSMKEKRDPELDEAVTSAFNEWRMQNPKR